MKRHILSTYGDFCEKSRTIDLGKTTYETSTVEVSDPDEFLVMGVTQETRSQESSDPDEFLLGPTNITKSVEATDADEFLLKGPTKLTFIQENTDEDEFLPDILNGNYLNDFDDILLV